MLTKLEISSAELTKLNYERYHYPCPLVQKRLHSIYIKAISGLSNEDIGNLTDAHCNSISEWVKVYRQEGIAAPLVSTCSFYLPYSPNLEYYRKTLEVH